MWLIEMCQLATLVSRTDLACWIFRERNEKPSRGGGEGEEGGRREGI